MGQSEVINLLEKKKKPLSCREIAILIGDDPHKVGKDLNKMIKYKEVYTLEIDKDKAYKDYNCKKRMRLYYVKGMMGATVDLVTGKIFGCEKGSKTYLHEEGHIHFNNSEWGSKISYYQIFFMMIAVFIFGLSSVVPNFYLKLFGFLNAFGMLACYAIEEIACWVYAFKHYRG